MKQGTVLTRAVMLLLFAAVCAYFAVAAWQSFHQSEYTMATYAYTVDDAVEAPGSWCGRRRSFSPGRRRPSWM